MSICLDRFSQTMPWEKKQEPMYDLCLDCGEKVPFQEHYCNECQERIRKEDELMKLAEGVGKFLEAIDCFKEYNALSLDSYGNIPKVQLSYDTFMEVVPEEEVKYTLRKHAAESYPYQVSVEINGCEIFALLDNEQCAKLGLIKKETAEAAN